MDAFAPPIIYRGTLRLALIFHLQYNLASGVPGIGNLVVTLHSGTLNLNNDVDILC